MRTFVLLAWSVITCLLACLPTCLPIPTYFFLGITANSSFHLSLARILAGISALPCPSFFSTSWVWGFIVSFSYSIDRFMTWTLLSLWTTTTTTTTTPKTKIITVPPTGLILNRLFQTVALYARYSNRTGPDWTGLECNSGHYRNTGRTASSIRYILIVPG